MKFGDNNLYENAGNVLDLIYFDEIRKNITNPKFPAFIIRGQYIKTITQIPGIDFFNLEPIEQEEKVQYFSAFLASIKSPVQILIHSKEIDTNKYLEEMSDKIRKTKNLNEEVKKEMLRGLPLTLNYIKNDASSSPFKKEYFLITSCKVPFDGDNIQEDKKNIISPAPYELGNTVKMSKDAWEMFENDFSRYYRELVGNIVQILDKHSKIKPFSSEEKIIGLFAELNNDIDRNSIPHIKNIL